MGNDNEARARPELNELVALWVELANRAEANGCIDDACARRECAGNLQAALSSAPGAVDWESLRKIVDSLNSLANNVIRKYGTCAPAALEEVAKRLLALIDQQPAAPQGTTVADYERELSAVMPADFKDWHQNSRAEWPQVSAGVIRSLREQLAFAQAHPPQGEDGAVAQLRIGQRVEWQDDIGRWWPVTITDYSPATYNSDLDDGTQANGYAISRFRIDGYTRPQPAPQAGEWVLVPREATPQMRAQGFKAAESVNTGGDFPAACWTAMLAAAPSHPGGA